jgi:pyruvate dehydrogenase E2 component (dihydrolipoamide acetyltransferase)
MIEIIMPKMGLNMSEGLIVEWLAKTGDEIAQGQEIASIESEKVVNNIEAETQGILHIAVAAGETVPVGIVIGYLLESGEEAPEQAETATPHVDSAAKPGSAGGGGAPAGVRVSPAARRRAQQLEVDLSEVSGSGPGGRITIEDVEKAASGGGNTAARDSAAVDASSQPLPGKRVPFTGVRKAIADAMSASQRSAAAVTLTADVDCSPLVEARKSGKGKREHEVSYNAIFIDVVASTLKQFPYMNARLEDDSIIILEEINIGLAMDSEQGLVVPVIQRADRLSLEQIEQRIRELIDKIRNRGATPDDFHGGTFTVTNLGAFGIDAFTPIINPGQAAILGIGRISERAVVSKGKVEIRPMSVLSLTFDHRLVDGAPAARFLNALKELMENLA